MFGAGGVRLCRRLPDDASAKPIARQLVRAATDGGANYEPARGAESLADFIHKVGIANKELREARYGSRLIEEAALVTDSDLAALIGEANELVAIRTASISANLGSTHRVDHGRPGAAITADRIGSREAEPRRRTALCDVSDRC